MLLALAAVSLISASAGDPSRVIEDQGVRVTRLVATGTGEPLALGERDLWQVRPDGTLERLNLPLLNGEQITDCDARDGHLWLLAGEGVLLHAVDGGEWVRLLLPATGVGQNWRHANVVALDDGAAVTHSVGYGVGRSGLQVTVVDSSGAVRSDQVLEGVPFLPMGGEWSMPGRKPGELWWLDDGRPQLVEVWARGRVQPLRDRDGLVWLNGHSKLSKQVRGQLVEVPLSHPGEIQRVLPARAGGIWVLSKAQEELWLESIPGGQALQVPTLERVLLRLAEPVPAALWLTDREAFQLVEGRWLPWRLRSLELLRQQAAESSARQAALRARAPWVAERPASAFTLIACCFGLGLFLLAVTSWAGVTARRGLLAAVATPAFVVFGSTVVAPTIEFASGWHESTSSMGIGSFAWFFASLATAGALGLGALLAAFSRARAVAFYVVACGLTFAAASLLGPLGRDLRALPWALGLACLVYGVVPRFFRPAPP